MIYRKVECPHCGNDFTAKNVPENQKCPWCRRLVKATFSKYKKRKWQVDVEPVDFPEEDQYRRRSVNEWERKDIYGHE